MSTRFSRGCSATRLPRVTGRGCLRWPSGRGPNPTSPRPAPSAHGRLGVRPEPLFLRQTPVDAGLAGHHAVADQFAAQGGAVPVAALDHLVHLRLAVAASLLE